MEPFEDEDEDVVVMGADWSDPRAERDKEPAQLAQLPAPKALGEPAQAKETLAAKAGKPKNPRKRKAAAQDSETESDEKEKKPKKKRKANPAAEDSETESDKRRKPAAGDTEEESDEKKKKPKKKRKANPAADESAPPDPAFIEKVRIELRKAQASYLSLKGKPVQQLQETGVTVVLMPPEEQKDLKLYLEDVAGMLSASFKLPADVTADLENGSSRAFYKHWGRMPSGKEKPVLFDNGMPQTGIQKRKEQENNTDKYGSVYTETPASQLSVLPWLLPFMQRFRDQLQHAQLQDRFPDEMAQIRLQLSLIDPGGADEEGEEELMKIAKKLQALEEHCRSHISGDGCKLHIPKHSRDGKVKDLTPVHVDQPFDAAATGIFKGIGTGKRFQASFCASTGDTKLVAVPSTKKGLALLQQKFKGRGGFQSMEHNKAVVDLLMEFSLGPEPGEVGTLFWTDEVPHGEIATGLTKSDKGTFRGYCGLKWLPAGFPVERLIEHASMRWLGYEFDPFAIAANKYNPLFVNGKSCQGHPQRRGPIPDIRVLLDLPLEKKKKVLREEASDFFLKSNGLTRKDLEEEDDAPPAKRACT